MNKITYLCLALLCCLTLTSQTSQPDPIQRVRIDFKTPQGYVRHLLLAFTPDNRASDGIDYGYDAKNRDHLLDDLNWMIGGKRYVIQGVGAYDTSKMYPFGMFLTNAGPIEISLASLENFSESIPVFIFDAWENTYYQINDSGYKQTLKSGIYENRFFITFNNQKQHVLTTEDSTLDAVTLNYLKNSKTLRIASQGQPLELYLYTLHGQLISKHKLKSRSTTHDLKLPFLHDQIVLSVLKSDQKTNYKRILIQ